MDQPPKLVYAGHDIILKPKSNMSKVIVCKYIYMEFPAITQIGPAKSKTYNPERKIGHNATTSKTNTLNMHTVKCLIYEIEVQ